MNQSPERFALVYQCGIANVFRIGPTGARGRILQHDYRSCEWYCAGLDRAGAYVETFHCDEAGDIAGRQWSPGPGDLWADSKKPVYSHAITSFAPES